MSWRAALLVPRLVGAGLRPKPRRASRWEAYWAGVRATGRAGDVLWDGAGAEELAWWAATARRYCRLDLPLVDAGCGNGRQSRALAPLFPRVLGIDLAPAAVAIARRESADLPHLRFEVDDLTRPGTGRRIRGDTGPANVVVRGVLHVLGPDDRRRLVDNVADLLAGGGVLVLLETAFEGSTLAYLEYLGGVRGRLPGPVARLVDAGVPRPARIGPDELTRLLPPARWTRIAEGDLGIGAVQDETGVPRSIPGHYAVVALTEDADDVRR